MPTVTLDFQKMLQTLNDLLKMGPSDEGTEGSLNDFKSGVKKNYLTYPEASEVVYVEEGIGTIRYPYSCRIRTEVYDLGVKTSNKDETCRGTITADFEFTIRGKVLITNIRAEGDRPGRAANSIVERIKSLNGKEIG
ncbi:hypothetical protein [Clostridium beijerinckii]|uniref:hypothetical protein n=1 Tax=Clostridium beijerinckii TaxID=1520 RepID=UPI00047C9BCB|nr:hypothetical protein [Clostridium beijerinckii]